MALLLGLGTHSASAVPAFARQTGQPCAACHTAFPELTPFGRAFKLGGYTLGGTRCGDPKNWDNTQIPVAFMLLPTFTHTKKDQPDLVSSEAVSFDPNNNLQEQETTMFIAGQLYCNVGAFSQIAFEYAAQRLFLASSDIKYADQTKIGDTDVLYGFTVNNSPTVQDAWNTTPVWRAPYVDSNIAPGPSYATAIEDTFTERSIGAGAYTQIDGKFYAEITGYRSMDSGTLNRLGLEPGGARIDGVAPYWRFAVENNIDEHYLMIGTFGMVADVRPDPETHATNRFTDLGIDAQYQYITDKHTFTVKTSFIRENQKLSQAFADDASDKLKNHLNSFTLSGTYTYDRTYSLQAGYFSTQGSHDDKWFGDSDVGSPNSRGFSVDVGYMPFSHGGPDFWPWLNARLGVQYVHWNELDGTREKASDNDTVFAYLWTAF